MIYRLLQPSSIEIKLIIWIMLPVFIAIITYFELEENKREQECKHYCIDTRGYIDYKYRPTSRKNIGKQGVSCRCLKKKSRS